jgi:biotin operon repressor
MAYHVFLSEIEGGAKFLKTPAAQAARGYLAKPLETALRVIDCLADGNQHTYEEIAEQCDLNVETVKQIIRALETGGYPIQFTYEAFKEPGKTGRKRSLVKRKK